MNDLVIYTLCLLAGPGEVLSLIHSRIVIIYMYNLATIRVLVSWWSRLCQRTKNCNNMGYLMSGCNTSSEGVYRGERLLLKKVLSSSSPFNR